MQKVFLVYFPKEDARVGVSIQMWQKLNPQLLNGNPLPDGVINLKDYALAGAVNAADPEMVFMMTQKGQPWSEQTAAVSFPRSTAVGELIAQFDNERGAIGDAWGAVAPVGFDSLSMSPLYADYLEVCANE